MHDTESVRELAPAPLPYRDLLRSVPKKGVKRGNAPLQNITKRALAVVVFCYSQAAEQCVARILTTFYCERWTITQQVITFWVTC